MTTAPFPGQSPGTYVTRFHGGPWDGALVGVDGTPPEQVTVDGHEGRYERESMSELPPDEDLTDKYLSRGAAYRWHA